MRELRADLLACEADHDGPFTLIVTDSGTLRRPHVRVVVRDYSGIVVATASSVDELRGLDIDLAAVTHINGRAVGGAHAHSA